MLTLLLLVVATAFLAFSNGANDNFKGVASLYGGGVVSYRFAIVWASVATAAGSAVSLLLAEALLRKFTGKGLVSDTLAGTAPFLLAVAVGAGLTVILATRLGFPVSTTHGLLGAMIGAGYAAAGVGGINLAALGKSFVVPLLLGPLLATLLGAVLYLGLRRVGRLRSPLADDCLCVDLERSMAPSPIAGLAAASGGATTTVLRIETCGPAQRLRNPGSGGLRVDVAHGRDTLHILSAGVVSFARGLNDTPKIAALALIVPGLAPGGAVAVAAAAIAAGGLLGARRVAETMSHKITKLDHEEGFASNLATGVLVILASVFGLPVSTTHVSVGSLFGIGAVTGQLNMRTMAGVALSWLVTLPCAAACAGMVYFLAQKAAL